MSQSASRRNPVARAAKQQPVARGGAHGKTRKAERRAAKQQVRRSLD